MLAGFFTFPHKREITVRASIYDVSPQLTALKNWKNWFPPMAGPDKRETGYSITVINPASVVLEKKEGGRNTREYVMAFPDSNGSVTRIKWIVPMNGYRRLWASFFPDKSSQEALLHLKAFVEDPSNLYGFPISLIPVADTVIVTKKWKLPPGEAREKIQASYRELAAYMQSKKIPAAKNYYYVSINPVNNRQTELAVGIPVNKVYEPDGNIEFLRLPAAGRLLSGRLTGDQTDIASLYKAIKKYAMDKHLKQVAPPLEKHEGLDGKDQVTLFLPIY